MNFTLLKNMLCKTFEVIPKHHAFNMLINGTQLLLPKFSAADFENPKVKVQTIEKTNEKVTKISDDVKKPEKSSNEFLSSWQEPKRTLREELHYLTDQEFNCFMRNLGQPENQVEIKVEKKKVRMSKEDPRLTEEEYRCFQANLKMLDERAKRNKEEREKRSVKKSESSLATGDAAGNACRKRALASKAKGEKKNSGEKRKKVATKNDFFCPKKMFG